VVGEPRVTVPLYQVDAFAARPFAGNPAAVCLLDQAGDDAWMQAVAAEMNLSETAFLHPERDGFRLRWFTPTVEVALCGHATLASAHVLWQTGRLRSEQEARFHTRGGLLTARLDGDWIEMDFPAVQPEPADPPPSLLAALGVRSLATYRAGPDYIVELASEADVRAARPNLALVAQVEARGVAVTAPASLEGFDIASRFFAPAAGIPEDPVTGSLHCALAPLWSPRLGKPELTAYQASARGGVLRLRLAGDRVLLSGQAVTVFHAELL
jgi:PhzF family phenazine biosynthesis protein